MKELLIMAKSLGGGGSEVALIELINALPEEVYNITLVLLDSDNEYAYRLKKKVNIVQLTFNSSFAKSLVSMYAFPAKVLKKLSVNSFIPYYDFISNCVTNVFEKTYDVAIDFYGYGSFVTAFLATKIQAKKKATWLHDEKLYWLKSVQKYLCKYDKVYGVSQAVVDVFCEEYPQYGNKADVFYNVIDIEEIKRKAEQDEVVPFRDVFNIVTVGRLTEQKGYDIAVKAANILKKKKIDFAWYAIGSGRDEKTLKKLVATYNLEEQFVFLGRKDNPSKKKVVFLVVTVTVIVIAFVTNIDSILKKVVEITDLLDIKNRVRTEGSANTHLYYLTSIPAITMKNDFISNLFGYGPGCSGYAQSELMNFYPELDKWSIECDYVNQLWSYGYIGFAIYYYWYIKNTLSTFKLDTKYVALYGF